MYVPKHFEESDVTVLHTLIVIWSPKNGRHEVC